MSNKRSNLLTPDSMPEWAFAVFDYPLNSHPVIRDHPRRRNLLLNNNIAHVTFSYRKKVDLAVPSHSNDVPKNRSKAEITTLTKPVIILVVVQ